MKRKIALLSFILFNVMSSMTNAQDDALTNSTIIRMAKAKLADDLIIDEIKNSRVNFNLSRDSIIVLQNEKVSAKVIQAMRDVSPPVPQGTAPAVDFVAPDSPVIPGKIEQPSSQVAQPVPDNKAEGMKTETAVPEPGKKDDPKTNPGAVGYVIPLKELITLYSGEFNSLSELIGAWDKKVKASLDEGSTRLENLRQNEKQLFDKINADSKRFSDEIKKLKENLTEERGEYMEFEDNMISDGLRMLKELESKGKDINRSISNKFGEVSQAVKKSDAELSLEGTSESFPVPDHVVDISRTSYLAPVNELLFFYRNEISDINELISIWNEKVISAMREDEDLRKKLDPLLAEITSLQSDQKTNRKKIAELKDQCSELEKERKRLGQKIKKDSSDLAKTLDDRCKDVLGSLGERLEDITENIKYLYQDSFTYRSI